VEAICLDCLNKSPEERPTMRDLSARLSALLKGESSSRETAPRPTGRGWLIALVVVLLGFAGLSLSVNPSPGGDATFREGVAEGANFEPKINPAVIGMSMGLYAHKGPNDFDHKMELGEKCVLQMRLDEAGNQCSVVNGSVSPTQLMNGSNGRRFAFFKNQNKLFAFGGNRPITTPDSPGSEFVCGTDGWTYFQHDGNQLSRWHPREGLHPLHQNAHSFHIGPTGGVFLHHDNTSFAHFNLVNGWVSPKLMNGRNGRRFAFFKDQGLLFAFGGNRPITTPDSPGSEFVCGTDGWTYFQHDGNQLSRWHPREGLHPLHHNAHSFQIGRTGGVFIHHDTNAFSHFKSESGWVSPKLMNASNGRRFAYFQNQGKLFAFGGSSSIVTPDSPGCEFVRGTDGWTYFQHDGNQLSRWHPIKGLALHHGKVQGFRVNPAGGVFINDDNTGVAIATKEKGWIPSPSTPLINGSNGRRIALLQGKVFAFDDAGARVSANLSAQAITQGVNGRAIILSNGKVFAYDGVTAPVATHDRVQADNQGWTYFQHDGNQISRWHPHHGLALVHHDAQGFQISPDGGVFIHHDTNAFSHFNVVDGWISPRLIDGSNGRRFAFFKNQGKLFAFGGNRPITTPDSPSGDFIAGTDGWTYFQHDGNQISRWHPQQGMALLQPGKQQGLGGKPRWWCVHPPRQYGAFPLQRLQPLGFADTHERERQVYLWRRIRGSGVVSRSTAGRWDASDFLDE
jgi:hypothetical protein